MPAPLVGAGIKLLPFAIAALSSWFGGRRQNQAARRAHNAQYAGNPRYQIRNALLTQLWREHNLQDRFKDAFPDPSTLAPGTMGKTPENILRAATTPPRFEGGGGAGILDSILGNLQRLPMPGTDPETGETVWGAQEPGLSMPAGGAPMPPGGVSVNAQGDPLDPFALTLPTTIPFRRPRY